MGTTGFPTHSDQNPRLNLIDIGIEDWISEGAMHTYTLSAVAATPAHPKHSNLVERLSLESIHWTS